MFNMNHMPNPCIVCITCMYHIIHRYTVCRRLHNFVLLSSRTNVKSVIKHRCWVLLSLIHASNTPLLNHSIHSWREWAWRWKMHAVLCLSKSTPALPPLNRRACPHMYTESWPLLKWSPHPVILLSPRVLPAAGEGGRWSPWRFTFHPESTANAMQVC